MEDTTHLFESLLDRVTDYGKTGYELVKLELVDTASNKISSFVPSLLVMVTLGCALFFINVGAACWLGEVLGSLYYGFFAVAGFNFIVAFVLHFFLFKWMKRNVYDYFIKQLLR